MKIGNNNSFGQVHGHYNNGPSPQDKQLLQSDLLYIGSLMAEKANPQAINSQVEKMGNDIQNLYTQGKISLNEQAMLDGNLDNMAAAYKNGDISTANSAYNQVQDLLNKL